MNVRASLIPFVIKPVVVMGTFSLAFVTKLNGQEVRSGKTKTAE